MKGSTPQCHRDPLRAREQEQVCFHHRRECSASPSCFQSWAVSSEVSRKGDSFSPSWRCCSDVCCKLWRCPKQSTESRWASELALPGRTSPPRWPSHPLAPAPTHPAACVSCPHRLMAVLTPLSESILTHVQGSYFQPQPFPPSPTTQV